MEPSRPVRAVDRTEAHRRALAELLAGEPPYRTRQVWEWAARGASSYGEMTNLPASLRARLQDEAPFSTLELAHEGFELE